MSENTPGTVLPFAAGEAVTLLQGDDIVCRPFLYIRQRDASTAIVAASWGELYVDPAKLRPWSHNYQNDWAEWLELEALKAERAAVAMRDFANLAKLSLRNAGIEATGRELREVSYSARNIGYGVEEGTVEGYWADGHDYTGKREFIPADGSESLYLFDDEVLSDDPVEQ